MNPIKEIRIQGTDLQGLEQLIEKAAQRIIDKTNTIKAAEDYPELMTQKQVGEYLQISRNTVVSLENKGVLKRVIFDDKVFRYNKIEVMAWKNKKK